MSQVGRFALWSIVILVASIPASAGSTRILNGDCEEAGASVRDVPHWVNDRENPFTYRLDGLGTNASAACVVLGSQVLRSAELFPVTPGESLDVRFDVWEMRDDDANRVERVGGDSVLAIEYVAPDGRSERQVQYFCDEYRDLKDNGRIDGSSTCDRVALHVHVQIPDPSIDCGATPLPVCLKYNATVPVPATAQYARVLLGGSLTLTVLENIRRTGLETPTSVTAFDNIYVGN